MRVSCWIDELPPPNGSDPDHKRDTISEDEGILFPLGLLECLLAQMVQAVRTVGCSRPWVNQVYLRSRRVQGRGWSGQLLRSPCETIFTSPGSLIPLCHSPCGSYSS